MSSLFEQIQSESVNEIATALAKAQGAIKGAIKDSQNPHFKSSYADLSSVWDACREPLSTNGLSVTQQPIVSSNGVTMITTLMHSSGQWLRSFLPVNPTKNDPQGLGSAITYMRRYALASMVGVAPDDDDDGNAASQPAGKQQAQTAKPAQTAEQKEMKDFAESFRAEMKAAKTIEDLNAVWAKNQEKVLKLKAFSETAYETVHRAHASLMTAMSQEPLEEQHLEAAE